VTDPTILSGDEVTRNGRAYRCLVAHGAAYQGTWGPPTVGVWARHRPRLTCPAIASPPAQPLIGCWAGGVSRPRG